MESCDSLGDHFSYRFLNKELLKEALSHRSYAHEYSSKRLGERGFNNERLEFLGDTVLQLLISHILLEQYPDLDEGKLSKMRSTLVNASCLANIARNLNLGEYILLGKGEEASGGREKSSILSASYEALLGLVYLEGGLEAANHCVQKHFSCYLKSVKEAVSVYDFKGLLQERVHREFHCSPKYVLKSEQGPDHQKIFTVGVEVASLRAFGKGESKKEAEQKAAQALFEALEKESFQKRSSASSS